jgi:hypothetical protein
MKAIGYLPEILPEDAPEKYKGVFRCGSCGGYLPSYYYSKKSGRWVSGAANFQRHWKKCYSQTADALLEKVVSKCEVKRDPWVNLFEFTSIISFKRIRERLSTWWYEIKLALAGIPAPW